LFRKFSADFAEKYRMPPLRLTEDAVKLLRNYYWPGNVRQLKNITEQISIIERNKEIDLIALKRYLPEEGSQDLPVLYRKKEEERISEREILYKVLFDMKRDMNELKKVVDSLLEKGDPKDAEQTKALLVNKYPDKDFLPHREPIHEVEISNPEHEVYDDFDHSEIIEESLSLQEKEKEMIKKALEKHNGKRKDAAQELGISERTLYRKIKEYNIK
jgi:DNA-binding NtrC family response regulator